MTLVDWHKCFDRNGAPTAVVCLSGRMDDGLHIEFGATKEQEGSMEECFKNLPEYASKPTRRVVSAGRVFAFTN